MCKSSSTSAVIAMALGLEAYLNGGVMAVLMTIDKIIRVLVFQTLPQTRSISNKPQQDTLPNPQASLTLARRGELRLSIT